MKNLKMAACAVVLAVSLSACATSTGGGSIVTQVLDGVRATCGIIVKERDIINFLSGLVSGGASIAALVEQVCSAFNGALGAKRGAARGAPLAVTVRTPDGRRVVLHGTVAGR